MLSVEEEAREGDGAEERRVIRRGAEAVLWLDGEGKLVKERVRKGYRIPELDEAIRRQRARLEVRMLSRARRSGVNAPAATLTDRYNIRMDFVDGERVKDAFSSMGARRQDEVAGMIGSVVAAMHAADIVHGDLTTSNMLLKDGALYMIDFGLGKVSRKVEDKATDLFLLWEAMLSTHYGASERAWKNIINTYVQKYENAREVMARFAMIERRRRYK
jgi:Kae1-associated kinase Bud32